MSGRRAGLAAAGLLLAGVMLAPYAVMVLTSLKPERELRASPPRLLPVEWRPGTFLDVLRDPFLRPPAPEGGRFEVLDTLAPSTGDVRD